MNKVEIKKYSPEIAQKWDEYVFAHDQSTFCHLIGWKKIVEKTFKHKSFYLYAERDDTICGILPLFLIKSLLFGKFLLSTPFAVYGGICADDLAIERLLLEAAKEIAENKDVDYLELRNIYKNEFDLPASELYVTFLQEMFPDNEDKNLGLMPRETRRLIRKANKAGLKSIVERKCIDDFYNIYSRSVKNLGTPVFPKKLFQNILDEFPEHSNMLHVDYNGKIIASVLTLYFKNTVMPYYGGALREYNSNKIAANNFMYWELMRYGMRNNYTIFDFGRSKVGTGAYNFKRHFGMNPLSLHYQYILVQKKELPNLNPTNPKYNLMINAWKRLPLSVANFIGPHIVKNIP